MARMSYISIVDAEEGGRAGVSEFNDFGVAVSFDVVVADLSVVKGDDHLFETMFLIERLVLDFFLLLLFVMAWIFYFLVVILVAFDGFVTFLLRFLGLLKLHALFRQFDVTDVADMKLVFLEISPGN